MRINSIGGVSDYYSFGKSKAKKAAIKQLFDKVSVDGANSDKLVMQGKADKYFTLVENLSNNKVGSKFLIQPKDPKYSDLKILITPESSIKSDEIYIGIQKNSSPSFKGRLYGSIRQDGVNVDTNMEHEYIRFWSEGMHSLISDKYTDKKYAPKLKDDYNFFIPSDGDGTRYKDITSLQGGVTKPATYIPASLNCKNMSLVQNVISNFTRTGKLDRTFGFIRVAPAQGSAFAFLEGLKSGRISTDKPIVFSWGDNFTDANISKIMYEHEKSGSAFTITTIPVEKSQTKSLSVVKIDSLANKKINDFVEKPQDDDFIESCIVPELGDNICLSAVGPYIISPKVLQWIKDRYIQNPESFKNPDKGYDFSSMIISPALSAIMSGEIKDAHMNLSIISDDYTWSDLGSQKDFSAAMKNIVLGAYSNLPEEILYSVKKNVDKNGNITFNPKSRLLFDSLISNYNLSAQNVIAYCKD